MCPGLKIELLSETEFERTGKDATSESRADKRIKETKTDMFPKNKGCSYRVTKFEDTAFDVESEAHPCSH